MKASAVVPSALLFLTAWPIAPAVPQTDSLGFCSSPPALQATVRPDNDISFSNNSGTHGGIPPAVKRKMDALAVIDCFNNIAYSNDPPLSLDRFYGRAFAVRGPDSSALYVFDLTGRLGYEVYYFILFDPATQRVTPRPAAIFAKWARDDDDACHRPFVTFEDLDHDGHPELVVRERTHNGTSYNACVRHYYRIDSDLGLDPILAVEERSWQDVKTPNTWLGRRIQFVSRDSLVLATYLQLPGHPEREVGELLVSKHPTERLHTTVYYIAHTRIIDPEYRDALLTDSPSHDSNFIFTGGVLWY